MKKLIGLSLLGLGTLAAVPVMAETGDDIGVIDSVGVAPVSADLSDIRAADKSIELDGGVSDFKYGESAGGNNIDSEHGLVPSLKLSGTWLTDEDNDLASNLFLHAEAEGTFGKTAFQGGLQDIFTGTISPSSSKSNNSIIHLSGQVGHSFPLASFLIITPYADVGYRSWWHQLTGSNGYIENFQQAETMGGVMAQISPMPRVVLTFSGEAGTTIGPQMRAAGSTYPLGASPIWQLDGKLGIALTHSFEWTLGAEFSGFGFGSSQSNGGFYVPASYTHQLIFLTGFAYMFD